MKDNKLHPMNEYPESCMDWVVIWWRGTDPMYTAWYGVGEKKWHVYHKTEEESEALAKLGECKWTYLQMPDQEPSEEPKEAEDAGN
jgi:hypothetical protein